MFGALTVDTLRRISVHEISLSNFIFQKRVTGVNEVNDFVRACFKGLVGYVHPAETMTADEFINGVYFFVDFDGIGVVGFGADT